MEVERTMTREVVTCRPEDSLAEAARRMRDRDCGALPVVDAHGRLVGMLTDRDACMAALERERPLGAIPVRAAMAREVVTLAPRQGLDFAAELMGEFQLRRLPVVDREGRLVGLVSLVDLARRAACGEMRTEEDVGMDDVSSALAQIGRPSPPAPLPASAEPVEAVEPEVTHPGGLVAFPLGDSSSRRSSW